jgi:hypothetical protein
MIQRLQGKIGNMVFRRTHSGTLSAGKLPDMSRVKWSPAQQEHRRRFKQAVALAKAAMVNPEVRKKYEKAAAKKGKRPFDLAVSDYFHGKKLPGM